MPCVLQLHAIKQCLCLPLCPFLPFYRHTHGVASGLQWKHSFMQLNKVELEFETWWDMLYCATLGGELKCKMHRKFCIQNSVLWCWYCAVQCWKPSVCNPLIAVLVELANKMNFSASITQSTLSFCLTSKCRIYRVCCHYVLYFTFSFSNERHIFYLAKTVMFKQFSMVLKVLVTLCCVV